MAFLLAPVPAHAANIGTNAEPDGNGVGLYDENVFYAYVKAGEWIYSWHNQGSYAIHPPNGGQTVNWGLHQAQTDGVWTVYYGSARQYNLTVFNGDPGTVDVDTANGEIDVSNTDVEEVTGRVWTERYGIRQGPTRDFKFWMLNDSGYQYTLKLDEYNGVNSYVAANSLGIPAGDSGGLACTPSYQSIDWPETGDEPDMSCSQPYRIFLESPAADLTVTAPIASTTYNNNRTTQVIKPEPVDPAGLSASDFSFTPETGGSAAGTFEYDLGSNFFGGHLLQIDVDGNGKFDDDVDRVIRVGAAGAPVSHQFDGLDGNGDPIAPCQPINARVFLDRVGEVHVLQRDVEGRDGIELIRQNGPGSPDSTIYWDDRQTTQNKTTTTPEQNGTAGVDSTGGAHGWSYSSNGWGDKKIIDDWTYVPADQALGSINIANRCVGIEKTSDATRSTRVGDTVNYTISATNTGAEDYTSADPASVVDDLSEVLDDAEFGDDARATINGNVVTAPERNGDRLEWSGPLASGDTVEITYSVTITGAGDGSIRNVAFAPTEGPPPSETPECESSGFDADAGVFCDTTSFDLPRLNIEKSANRTTLPAVGEEVEFTITATNNSDGYYTEDAPALVVDDLSEVLDDATIDEESIAANLDGDLDLKGNRIVWSGALAPGQSVVITYTVTYTGEGDNSLDNVAFGPDDEDEDAPVCDPRDEYGLDPDTGMPCDRVQVPGSGLQVQKSVDPTSGTNVAPGDELSYTLTFTNSGQAPAAVDHVDHLAGLLDDAEVTADPASDDLTVSAISGGFFTIAGSVPAGESYTVTYTVTVNEAADLGDSTLGNFVTESGEEPPADCVPGSEHCTVNYVPNLRIDKESNPDSGAAVQSGDEIAYTLRFTNTGAGTATVGVVDDLSDVLDDAALIAGPSSANLTVDLAGTRLAVSGSVAAGSPQTVTYTVRVNPDGEHGNNVMANVITTPDGDTPEGCGEGTCTTDHPVGELAASKSVDPISGTSVNAGDVLTYTLSFENVGTAPVDVDKVDDLSGVLDDAALSGDPETSGGLDINGPSDGRLAITGTLEADASGTVTYRAKVLPPGERGDDTLDNFLINPGEETPEGPCTPVEGEPVTCTSNPIAGVVTATKSVDPRHGTQVRGGDSLTYTLTFRNESRHAAQVDYVDHLAGILDDAIVAAGPTTSTGDITAVRSGNVIEITGALESGQSATVTYRVNVKKSNRGDDQLANFLLPTGELLDPDATCQSDDPMCTSNPVVNDVAAGLPKTGALSSPWAIIAALVLIGVGFGLVRNRFGGRHTA